MPEFFRLNKNVYIVFDNPMTDVLIVSVFIYLFCICVDVLVSCDLAAIIWQHLSLFLFTCFVFKSLSVWNDHKQIYNQYSLSFN